MQITILPLKVTLKGCVSVLAPLPSFNCFHFKKGKEQMRNEGSNTVIVTNLFSCLCLTVRLKCYSDAILVQNVGASKLQIRVWIVVFLVCSLKSVHPYNII